MNKINNKYFVAFFHAIVWIILFISPYLLTSGQSNIERIIARIWIPLFFYATIFYLNYFLLINRFLFKKKIFLFVVINLFLIAFFIIIRQELIMNVFTEEKPPLIPNENRPPSRSFFLYISSITFVIPIIFSIAIRIAEKWLKAEAEKQEIENIKLQTELQHLKYQLQPHFFFNSLNTIYSLIDISPNKAKETIHSLSKLMRYLLYESNTEQVSLSKEIDFMNNYIELMKLRLTDKTTVISSFPKVNENIQVAPLLFISIVENAFKHGISANQKSEIQFFMNIEHQKIHFLSKNKNVPKNENDKSGSGIGLENLKKRLDLLYPDKYSYKTEIKDDEFITVLCFELNQKIKENVL